MSLRTASPASKLGNELGIRQRNLDQDHSGIYLTQAERALQRDMYSKAWL